MISPLLPTTIHKVKKYYNKILIIFNILKTSKKKPKDEKKKGERWKRGLKG